MSTYKDIQRIIESRVSVADYMQAMNDLRGLPLHRSDLDEHRIHVMILAKNLADAIDDFQSEVRRAKDTPLDCERIAKAFDASAHGHLITDRPPVDDEQPSND